MHACLHARACMGGKACVKASVFGPAQLCQKFSFLFVHVFFVTLSMRVCLRADSYTFVGNMPSLCVHVGVCFGVYTFVWMHA